MRRRATAAAVLLLGACQGRQPIASCTDDLGGVYATPSGRWMILDSGATLEAYPLFDDSVPGGAPRLIDLARGAATDRLDGEEERRYTQRGDTCDARAPLHVTRCAGDALQVVRGEPQPPLAFAPCRWGQAMPSHVETWRRD